MSKLADYAFIILSQMIDPCEKNWSAASLASATSLPLPTVAKLMKLLAKNKIVQAQRGASGGYRLACAPGVLSAVQIIEAVDGPISLTGCANDAAPKNSRDCVVEETCPIKENWARVNLVLVEALERVKLSDFAPTGDAA